MRDILIVVFWAVLIYAIVSLLGVGLTLLLCIILLMITATR